VIKVKYWKDLCKKQQPQSCEFFTFARYSVWAMRCFVKVLALLSELYEHKRLQPARHCP